MPTSPTAESIARHFLHLAATAQEPTPLTQMQLHKLLYYAQGWFVAMRGGPLFVGAIQAWTHGPVVPDAHPIFKRFGDSPIPPDEGREDNSLTDSQRTFLLSIWESYGCFSAWRLREMTHSEKPWLNARGSLPDDAPSREVISEQDMGSHFRSIHDRNCRRVGIDPAVLEQSIADARAGRTTELKLRPREEWKYVAR